MEEIEYIPMEPDLRLDLKVRYTKPFRIKVIVMTTIFALLYLLIIAASNGATGDGSVKTASRSGDTDTINITTFNVVLGVVLLIFYLQIYLKISRMNIHYLKDARYGFILKERMTISRVFPTPAGINIYWLDHPGIKTFTPDPYRRFREGDQVFIYYLKYAKEYLAYEM